MSQDQEQPPEGNSKLPASVRERLEAMQKSLGQRQLPAVQPNPAPSTTTALPDKEPAPSQPATPSVPEKAAVALSYDIGSPDLPRIVATGRGRLAEEILRLAFEAGVKVRQDADLAQMLVTLDLDSEIPSEAIEMVAEILAYVYKANGRMAEMRAAAAAEREMMKNDDGSGAERDLARRYERKAEPPPAEPVDDKGQKA